jgi:hypothetical protein
MPCRTSTVSPGKATIRLIKHFVRSTGYQKDYDITAFDRLKMVDKLIDEDPFLIAEQRSHAGALNQYRLIKDKR